MGTLQRGWRGLYAVKPGRSAHPHEDDRPAANPRLPPLPRASRGVASESNCNAASTKDDVHSLRSKVVARSGTNCKANNGPAPLFSLNALNATCWRHSRTKFGIRVIKSEITLNYSQSRSLTHFFHLSQNEMSPIRGTIKSSAKKNNEADVTTRIKVGFASSTC